MYVQMGVHLRNTIRSTLLSRPKNGVYNLCQWVKPATYKPKLAADTDYLQMSEVNVGPRDTQTNAKYMC